MYTRIHVKNLRGLQDLLMEDLGRVNLVVGPNNIGKTSLLEALWLFHGPANSRLTLNLAVFRGLDPAPNTPELLWHGLFYNVSLENQIEIEGAEISESKHSLWIKLSKAQTERIAPESLPGVSDPLAHAADTSALAPETLQYQYTVDGGQPVTVNALASRGIIEFQVAPQVMRPSCIFLSARRRTNDTELANRFTKVQDSGRLDTVVQCLRLLEPTLKTLSLGYIEGRPLIRGHLQGLDTPLLLPLLGGGMVRLTEVLLAVFTASGGLVLIDEAENGLYHRNLEGAWSAINYASSEANVQIFATTHSQECVKAAVSAFAGEHAPDFRVHRMERKKDQVHVVTYDHETAAAALDMNLEVR